MQISGNGITTFDLYRFKYKVKTTPSYKFIQTDSGFYYSIDRGASEDLYETTITCYGNITEIDNILWQLRLNRINATPNNIILSDFAGAEDMIFGANIDYSGTLTANITKLGKRKQKSFKIFECEFSMQLMSPYTYTGTAQLPTKFNLYYQYQAYGSWSNNFMRHYDNSLVHAERNIDVGTFEGTFLMDNDDIRNFRSLLLTTNRDGEITLTDTNFADCLKPFGPRMTTSFPMDVVVLKFDDQVLNHKFWTVKLTLAETEFLT